MSACHRCAGLKEIESWSARGVSEGDIVEDLLKVFRTRRMTSNFVASTICLVYTIFDLDLLAFRTLLEAWWTAHRSTTALQQQMLQQIRAWSTKPYLKMWALYLEGLERHMNYMLSQQVSVKPSEAWSTQERHSPTQYFAEVSQNLRLSFDHINITPSFNDYVFVAFKHPPAGSESDLGTSVDC
jgi:hypothetical protein